MAVFDKFKKKSPEGAAPVTPPDQPASSPAAASKPVEGFQAVPPPKNAAPADDEEAALLKQLEASRAKKAAAAEAAKAAAAEQAANEATGAEAEAKKNKGGRPPGAKNKPKPGEGGSGGDSVTVSYGVTMNVGDFNGVRIDASFTHKCEADELEETYEALLNLAKEKVEAEMHKVNEGTKLKPVA